jgi:hypothetical protein
VTVAHATKLAPPAAITDQKSVAGDATRGFGTRSRSVKTSG